MFHEGGLGRSTPALVTVGLVAVAVIVAAAASLVQNVHRATSPSPAPVPNGVTVSVLQAPPPGQPLLWFRDDSTSLPFVLRATDWNGRTLGRVSVSCSGCGLLASPDGRRLLLGDQSAPGLHDPDRIFAADGRLLSSVDGFRALWSDDGSELCTVRPHPGAPASQADLAVADATSGKSRLVATIAAGATSPGSQWSLLSCSGSSDRAVAALSHDSITALRVVQLSSGRLLTSVDNALGRGCACAVASLAVSGSGLVAVENPVRGDAAVRLDLTTGVEHPLTAWQAHGPVVALSWSGALAVTPLGVYAVASGAAVWQAPLPAYVVPISSRPRSDQLLLSVWQSSGTSGRAIVVRQDGSTAAIGGAELAQPPLLPF